MKPSDETNFKIGGLLAIKNAIVLYESAQDSAAKTNVGLGTSLAILSAEEAIKAYLCFQKHFYPQIEIPQFNKVFESHGIKHRHIVFMLRTMKHVFTEVKADLPWMKKAIFLYLKSVNAKVTEQDKSNIEQISNIEIASFIPFPYSEEQVAKWHKIANNSKNNGLYVSLKSDQWISLLPPIKVSVR